MFCIFGLGNTGGGRRRRYVIVSLCTGFATLFSLSTLLLSSGEAIHSLELHKFVVGKINSLSPSEKKLPRYRIVSVTNVMNGRTYDGSE